MTAMITTTISATSTTPISADAGTPSSAANENAREAPFPRIFFTRTGGAAALSLFDALSSREPVSALGQAPRKYLGHASLGNALAPRHRIPDAVRRAALHRRAGTVADAGGWNGPGSAARHFIPRRIRDTARPPYPCFDALSSREPVSALGQAPRKYLRHASLGNASAPRDRAAVSRTRCSVQRCDAEPGPLRMTGLKWSRISSAAFHTAPHPGHGASFRRAFFTRTKDMLRAKTPYITTTRVPTRTR